MPKTNPKNMIRHNTTTARIAELLHIKPVPKMGELKSQIAAKLSAPQRRFYDLGDEKIVEQVRLKAHAQHMHLTNTRNDIICRARKQAVGN